MASPAPLTKEQRTKCHKAKDLFVKCMDDSSNDIYQCEMTWRAFESSCPKKWVGTVHEHVQEGLVQSCRSEIQYFVQRRQFNQFREAQDKLGYIRKTPT